MESLMRSKVRTKTEWVKGFGISITALTFFVAGYTVNLLGRE